MEVVLITTQLRHRIPVRNEIKREATQLSATKDVSQRAPVSAAIGMGNRLVNDPLAGIPNSPFFNRELRFFSGMDGKGRVRLCAFTINSSLEM